MTRVDFQSVSASRSEVIARAKNEKKRPAWTSTGTLLTGSTTMKDHNAFVELLATILDERGDDKK
jgi:hypothetical protein